MRTFKHKSFVRFARKERITDAQLSKAVAEAEAGLIDADLGGGVIKQRIARPHEGKSGGYRSIILFKAGDRAFFVNGFAKNDLANITRSELESFRSLARVLLNATEDQLCDLMRVGEFREVLGDAQENIQK